MVESAGHVFPGTLWENQLVPEALSYKQDRLPHRRSASERGRLFPRAVAAAEAGDADFEKEPCALSQRGMAVVEAKERGNAKVKEKEDPRRGEQQQREKYAESYEPKRMNKEVPGDREGAPVVCEVAVTMRYSDVQEGDKKLRHSGGRQVGYGVLAYQSIHDCTSDVFI